MAKTPSSLHTLCVAWLYRKHFRCDRNFRNGNAGQPLYPRDEVGKCSSLFLLKETPNSDFRKKVGILSQLAGFFRRVRPVSNLAPSTKLPISICQLFWNAQVGEYSQDCPRGYSWNLYRRRCVLKFTSGWSYDECIFGKVNLRCVIIGSLVCTQKCLPRL